MAESQIREDGLIFTNDNCMGCNRCIAACSAPAANVARLENGKNKIHIDSRHCINCGQCIEVCPHDAREYRDDTEAFLDALAQGKAISVVAAPAVRTNFSQYNRLFGALRALGARQFFDTSFGADICTWAHLRYIEKTGTQGLVSQPCPAVVSYVEKHAADLLPKLSPVHSPAMCTAIFMRKYQNIAHEIAFLSPCIAKKEEINDPNNQGLMQYNVTYQKLDAALKARGIDYSRYEPVQYDNVAHGLGAIYPTPGGLKANVLRHAPDAWVYQVEGQPGICHFLDHYAGQAKSGQGLPLLVDALNCLHGCNLGTGALRTFEDHLDADRTMHANAQAASVAHKSLTGKKRYPGLSLQDFDKMLRLDDFIRRYTAKEMVLAKPNPEQAFQRLYKFTEEDRRIDCGSCGYKSCRQMAEFITQDLNHPENCVEYHKNVLKKHQEEIEDILARRENFVRVMQSHVSDIHGAISQSSQLVEDSVSMLAGINEEIYAVDEISASLNGAMDTLRTQIGLYAKMSKQIVDISLQTKLLSMNASVEAAHAREYGKGFAVVAEEMKSMSDQSSEAANIVMDGNEAVFKLLEDIQAFCAVLNEKTRSISGSTEDVRGYIGHINQLEHEVGGLVAKIVEVNESGG